MLGVYSAVVWWTLFLPLACGHLCLIVPRQRGDMDISRGGSPTCFRHGAECGGIPGQYPPSIELEGGRPIFIKWQQNYNHYTVGYPGYMDIGYAVANQDDVFTILAEIPDVDEYNQYHQRNYTAVVTLPNMDCDHCVIRARYVAHKPGETIFYQCADVRVKKTNSTELVKKRGTLQLLDAEVLDETAQRPRESATSSPLMHVLHRGGHLNRPTRTQGARSQPSSSDSVRTYEQVDDAMITDKLRRSLDLIGSSLTHTESHLNPTADYRRNQVGSPQIVAMGNNMESIGGIYYQVDSATGERHLRSFLNFRIDSPYQMLSAGLERAVTIVPNATRDYVTNGVFSFDNGRGVTVLPLNPYGNMDAMPTRIVEIDSNSGALKTEYDVTFNQSAHLTPYPFSAILVEIESSFVTFSVVPAAVDGDFDFVVGRLHAGGHWVQMYKTTQPEDTYVNFQWAEYDTSVKTMHVLMGNENDAYNLTARLYHFFVPPWDPPIGPVTPGHSFVQLDVSQFTFMSFHLNPLATDKLYAISPGRHDGTKYPAFHLVSINADTGSVSHIMQIAPPGIFSAYYGGTVRNGLGSLTNQLVHVLRVGDTHADVIVTIDVIKRAATFSQPTSVSNLYNLACIWNT